MRLFLFISALLLAPLLSAFEIPANSSQCIVGIADGWNTSHVTLTFYEKQKGQWVSSGKSWKGRLGKNGLVWGLGLHPNPKGPATKQEGDMRSPAGVFDLGGAWGYDKAIKKNAKLPYRQITTRDLWVEDPQSPSYNRNVVLDREPSTPWEKKQQMKQNDYPQSLKLFISHNAPPRVVPNAGSSIFFHIWRGEGSRATAGCTTMPESQLRPLIARIDPARRPVYVLLPKAEYDARRAEWKLP